ncbi:MAG: hypothetical protein KatS3mg076_2052 [Candidatus Binatia bacterium]|nr:MAG: hypothetical protein KatS3mg076_2052 [Candidatus Binatia bacterium]
MVRSFQKDGPCRAAGASVICQLLVVMAETNQVRSPGSNAGFRRRIAGTGLWGPRSYVPQVRVPGTRGLGELRAALRRRQSRAKQLLELRRLHGVGETFRDLRVPSGRCSQVVGLLYERSQRRNPRSKTLPTRT